MTAEPILDQARDAFDRQQWSKARSAYASVGQEIPLTLDDIERFAVAAHLLGNEPESRDVLARGYRESRDRNDASRAARFAFFIGHSMIFTDEMAQANGWFSRARSLLNERGADCVEWGYLLVPTGIEQLFSGDANAAAITLLEAQAIGRRFADSNLAAIAGHGRGRALIRAGLTGEGFAALDEAIVAVATGEVSPLIVGQVYCGVLEACQEAFDLRRAREWTAIFSRWCEGQSDLVPYRGPCLVHRVELMRLRGDWEDALEEARRACDWLSMPSSPEGPADAFYQLGELCRLRGDFSGADEAYRQASRLGRPPEPGLSLLWLARGQGDAAATAVRRALDEGGTGTARHAELLAALVEISLSQGKADAAQNASTELTDLAAGLDAMPLQALAARAEGSVLIAIGEPHAALAPLRQSWITWQRLEAPYEAARSRTLIAMACRALGDAQSAAMEFDAARWVFERLGAAPDIARLNAEDPVLTSPASSLTPREVDVLRLITEGETNKAIAAALVISEHTVARHVQNMLQKLGFSSRASLAVFAVEQGLIRHPTGSN